MEEWVSNMMPNKRAQLGTDMIVIVITIFVIALVGLFMWWWFSSFNRSIQSSEGFTPESKVVLQGQADAYPGLIDGFVIFIFAGLWVALIMSSFMVDTHPAFLIIMVILLVFVMFGSAVLANYFLEQASSEGLSTASADLPMTMWLFDHFVLVLVFMGASSSLVLFGKSFGSGI